uniref:L1-like cell adhesion molecule n=1 Tax=Dugesia japonica TaxID=6161 RepID=Q1JUB3_DUGJA|nr:L1-like cell adhesion molecule [Dugesia japonica]
MISFHIILFCCGFLMFTPGDCVYYPPSFVYQPNKNEVYQNLEALMLRCVATGSPSPTYTWLKNNKVFDFSINVGRYTKWPNEGTMILALPNDDDDGIYQCIAENSHGKAYSIKSNVRRAEIQNFKNKDPEKITARQGEYLLLKCEVPVCFPPPIVVWQKIKNGIAELIKESSKYVMDIDGNLYITGLTMEDDQAKFSCTVYNQRMRMTKSDKEHWITVIPGQSNLPVVLRFRSLQPMNGRVGDKLVLRCILSGYPSPNYKWTVKGQDKSILERPNFITDAGGAILIINPVTTADQDTFQCTGENAVSNIPIVIDFQVNVEMTPILTTKLSDANVPYNGSHVFSCEAIGRPNPVITWTVNGVGLDTYLNGQNKRKIGNTIYLTNLLPGDHAVFQCNASNYIGYDYSNGYINVLRDKPEFINGPQATLIKAENKPATINCQAFSAPKAIVTWTKDGFPINGGRYMIQDNGDLLITKLITADSGTYTCTATNLYGSISGTCVVFVRQRTELMIRPINTWVYFGQEVKFVCTAKTDRLETQNLKIVWYKDNSPITIGPYERTNTNLQDNSLIIMGAQTTDTGIYTCNATNGLDFDVAYATLIVQGKPHTPIDIKADCSRFANNREAVVSWNPGADNYAPIVMYLVEYSTQFDRKGWYEVQKVTKITGSTGETVDVKVAMQPFIQYQFRVRAINRVGVSEPSDVTLNPCSLPPTIPNKNPKEVFVYGTAKDNLVIQWTPMTYVEHCAPKLVYHITVICITCQSIPKNATNTTFISDWDQNIVTYYNFQLGSVTYDMESFQQFKVTIQAKNEIGLSSGNITVGYGYSGDDSPVITSAQLAMTAGAPGKGYVPLSWTILSQAEVKSSMKGFFRGYRIEWCLASLSDLECDVSTQYQDVILVAQNLPVLYGNKRRKRSVDENDENELNEVKYKYDTKYRQVIPDNLDSPMNFQVLSRRKRAVLTNPDQWNYGQNFTAKLTLIPGNTAIKIWLRALNAIYASTRSDPPIQITTFEDTPGPVIDFNVLTLSINHVVLQWKSPTETNGIITGYRLAWREINGLELGYMTTYPDLTDPNQLQFQMSGLKAQTNYRILIWALTSQGAGIESFIDIQTQPAHIAPNAPMFTVNSVVNNTVNITFSPSDTGVKGSVFYAQYRKVGQYRWDESEPQYIKSWIYIINLANDTTYELRMVATNGAGMATPSITGTFRTQGKLDPTRPIGSNAIWIVMVIIIIIFCILLFVFVLWKREKRMDEITGKPVQESQMLGQSKVYDSIKQPLMNPSDLGTSVLSGPVSQPIQSESVNENGSIIENSQSLSDALIQDSDDLPPVSYEPNPRVKKHKSRKPKPVKEDSAEEDDAII